MTNIHCAHIQFRLTAPLVLNDPVVRSRFTVSIQTLNIVNNPRDAICILRLGLVSSSTKPEEREYSTLEDWNGSL